MAQSLNTKVDLVMDATSFHGMNNYGKIMIGDRGFEYYNEKKMNDYIQIPWEEVDYVIASVMFKGKYIPRFAIQTKKSGTFTFAAKKPKELLRAVRNYVNISDIKLGTKYLLTLTFYDGSIIMILTETIQKI